MEGRALSNATGYSDEWGDWDKRPSGLSFLTKLLAVLSVVVVGTALATNNWLLTEELITRVPLFDENATMTSQQTVTTQQDEPARFLEKTIAGLWTVCISNLTTGCFDCFQIFEVFDESYVPDPGDSAWAMPYAASRSIGFFLLATVLLCFAEVCFVISLLKNKDWIIFVSGVSFIIAGLLMLVGVIALISLFRAEVGNKLRPASVHKSPTLTFNYGFSFQLYMGGLALIEATGTCAIFLYLKSLSYSTYLQSH
ncbi:voltage-dependent calcium channel gamma-8 subunit isoform X1 [Bemisia tabaci]|uniref:voltage-dependent calcium channel gamma-8 subunit isoform X1 n=1 Tax=Bemisia tabaci TaxID=7038 RepID=UPI003B2845A7